MEKRRTMEATIYAVRTDTVRELGPAAAEKVEKAMPARAARARRFLFEKDRLLCLGAGLLMMEALGIRGEGELRYGPYGKPYAPGYPAFSLSHSGAWCVLATGDGFAEIGVDIEEVDARHIGVAPTVFTPAELAWMQADPVERFFRLWTWKESVMKAAGLGMALEPVSFDVLPFLSGRAARIAGREWHAAGEPWDNCICSVCADKPIGKLRWAECRSFSFRNE